LVCRIYLCCIIFLHNNSIAEKWRVLLAFDGKNPLNSLIFWLIVYLTCYFSKIKQKNRQFPHFPRISFGRLLEKIRIERIIPDSRFFDQIFWPSEIEFIKRKQLKITSFAESNVSFSSEWYKRELQGITRQLRVFTGNCWALFDFSKVTVPLTTFVDFFGWNLR